MTTGEPSAVDFGLVVSDADASLHFYREVIGCRLEGELTLPSGHLWALRVGSSALKLLQWHEPRQPSRPVSFATGTTYLTFRVGDPDEVVARCEAVGARVVRSPYDFSASVRNAIVLDPDGNTVELCRGVAWDASR